MTKALYIDHPEGDFLSGIVYLGLREELGKDGVVDWPWKASFHGQVARYKNLYLPENLGIRWDDPSLMSDGADRIGDGITAPFAWMPTFENGDRWGNEEVADRIGEFDVVILASIRNLNDQALEWLISRVGRQAIKRLVVIDGQDSTLFSEGHHQTYHTDKFAPSVYFKRELLADVPRQLGSARVLPCPFAAYCTPLPSPEPPASVARDIDVVLLQGGNFHAGRGPYDDAVKRASSNSVTGYVPYGAYLPTLARAKISIVLRGHGWDTVRFWETASCEGTLLACDRQPIVRPHPFVDGEHCVEFSSPTELESRLRELLNDEPRRARIAAAGYDWLHTHHTARARARYILEESAR
jgi:hypothetical protein